MTCWWKGDLNLSLWIVKSHLSKNSMPDGDIHEDIWVVINVSWKDKPTSLQISEVFRNLSATFNTHTESYKYLWTNVKTRQPLLSYRSVTAWKKKSGCGLMNWSISFLTSSTASIKVKLKPSAWRDAFWPFQHKHTWNDFIWNNNLCSVFFSFHASLSF